MGYTLGQEAGYTLTARRNNSITSSSRMLAFGLPALFSLTIAIAFALLGAWLVLPFAGLEVLVLWWAFRVSERHALDFERVTISDDNVVVEIGEGGRIRRFQMNRWWAQVVSEGDGSWLALRSHGREIALGRHLSSSQRLRVAGELRIRLRAQSVVACGLSVRSNN